MKNRVMKAVLIIALIITLTIADFVLLGTGLATYALENDNVSFTAYFKTEEGKAVSQAEYEMTNNEMKLYLEVAVEDGVDFDGVITLGEGSNFKFKNKLSQGINKIEGNTITLETIKKGNTAKIEVAIEPALEESYGSDMLSKESTLTLTGSYDDGTEEIEQIDLESKVILNLTAPAGIDTTLEGKVITNRIYTIGEENKKIVQLNLNSTVVENAYPIKATTFTIELPEGVEGVEVISKGTYATNGKADRVLEETTDYTWDEENKLLQVSITNPIENEKISWKKDAIDNIVVTLTLDDETTIGTEEYSVKQKVELYGQESKTIDNKEIKYNLTEEADGMIRASVENKEEIYKGKLYSQEEREYNSTTKIEINYANLVEGATVEETAVYKTKSETEKAANIIYTKTTISKSEFDKVLGANGTLTIKDQAGNLVQEIKATSFGENESLTVEYATAVTGLVIEISKAEQTGIIRLNHTKVIKEQYSRTEIEELEYLVEKASVTYDTVQYSFEYKTQLKETTSEAVLTVTPQTISAEQESKDVQVAITLKTDNESYELFQAPTFTLTVPEGVTINSVSNGTVSASDGELVISKLESNGREIKIETTGGQQKYITSNINTQITFTANVSVEKLMANKVDTIKMQYTNQGVTYDIESASMNIVASNSKIATHLKVENYDGLGSTLERYSDSTSKVKGEIPLNSAETINVPVTYTIINNFDSAIAITAKIIATLTDNSDEEKELINYSNSEIIIDAKKMQVVEQTLQIPAGLYYSEKINIEATTEYTYSGTEYSLPNNIILSTEEKEGIRDISVVDDKVKLETFAQFGDGTGIQEDDEIYNEQIIEYVIEVTNISNEPISNLKITNKQENGNIYDIKSIWVYNYVISEEKIEEHRYAELDTDTKTFEIATLKPGETQELICGVVVKKNESNNVTTANISISADGIEEKVVQKISNKVKDSKLKIITEKSLNEEVQMYGNSALHMLTYVENLTDKDIKDIKGRAYLSEGLTFPEDYTLNVYDEKYEDLDIIENITYNKKENYIDFNITKLEENQKVIIKTNLYINSMPLEEQERNEEVYLEINGINSNAARINVKQLETELSVIQKININEGTKVKDGEKIIITGEVTNIGYVDTTVIINDELPLGLEVEKVELIKNGETTDKTDTVQGNVVLVATGINEKEKVTIRIEAVVNTSLAVTEEITNKILALTAIGEGATSNEITIQIDSDVINDSGIAEDENPSNPDDPNNPNPDDGDEGNKETTYTISGYAWVDKNSNGTRDDDEAIPNVIVKIIDLDNNNIFLKDKDGKEIEVKTDESGKYEISELSKGNYNVIFKYDTSVYELPTTTNIKDYIVENTNEKMAITTNIKLESNQNIDLKLMELTEFNLKIDKYITKAIVQTSNGTKTTEYANKQLVREEIQRKYLSGATVLVEYTMEISNIGELAGYATEIVDYLPSDMKFHSELNTQWYIGEDGNLYNTSLASALINPGETKTVKLILLKTMTAENTGTTTNNAEISDMMNIKEYADIDLNDNQSKAEMIVNTATGTIIAYTIAIINAVVIVAIGLWIIKKKIIGKE